MSKCRAFWGTLGSVFAPFLVMSVYLYFSRGPTRWFTAVSDNAALGLSLAVGAACFLCLPFPPWARAVGTVLYTLVIVLALFFYSLMFVGCFFNDWL